jgi:hypothetical protein
MKLQDQMQRSREDNNLLGMVMGGLGEIGGGLAYDYLSPTAKAIRKRYQP